MPAERAPRSRKSPRASIRDAAQDAASRADVPAPAARPKRAKPAAAKASGAKAKVARKQPTRPAAARRPPAPARAPAETIAWEADPEAPLEAADEAPEEEEFEEYRVPEADAYPEFPTFPSADGSGVFDAQRTLGEWLEGIIPVEAQGHFLNAGKEFAAGVQVTLDHHTGRRRQHGDGRRAYHIDIE